MKIKNKIILCVCSFVLMICTMFSFVPISKSDSLVVKADEVVLDYTYRGSNFHSKVDFEGGSQSDNLIGFPNSDNVDRGINIITNDDTIILDGTSSVTGGVTLRFYNYNLSLTSGTYYLSFDIDYNCTNPYFFFGFNFVNSSNVTSYQNYRVNSTDSSCNFVFTFTEDVTFNFAFISYNSISGYPSPVVFDNLKIYNIMLTQDSTYPDYVRYRQYNDLSFKFDFIANKTDDTYDNTFVDITPIISGYNNYWLANNNNTLYNVNHYTFETNAYGSVVFPMKFVSHNKVVGSDDYITDFDTSFTIYTMINKIPSGSNGYFVSDISRIVFGSYLNGSARYLDSGLSLMGITKYNFVAFYNPQGLSLDFIIPLTSNIESDYFDYRTYYLNDNYDETGLYTSGYNQGYNTGYQVGKEEYSAVGFDKGYNVGYNAGFSDGVEDSNQYTFLNLISATIDAPITYFQQLFNFELLGVNLQGFLTGLFTLCVIVTIIKLCLGG